MSELSSLNSKVVLFLVRITLRNYGVKHLLLDLETEVSLLNKMSQKDSNQTKKVNCSEFHFSNIQLILAYLVIKSGLFNVYYPFFTCVQILSVNICLTVMILNEKRPNA